MPANFHPKDAGGGVGGGGEWDSGTLAPLALKEPCEPPLLALAAVRENLSFGVQTRTADRSVSRRPTLYTQCITGK